CLIAEHPSSAEVLKPFLRGRDVKRWRVDYQDLWLIFTRKGTQINNYPAIKRHLEQFRESLEKRLNVVRDGDEWFQIPYAISYWQEFDRSKILIPAIAQSVEYAADFSGYYGNDKTSICVTDEVEFLLGILNSKIMWWFIQQIAASKQGGFYEFKPMYVTQIPIISATDETKKAIETLVNYILFLAKELKDIPSHGAALAASAEDKLMLSYFEQILNAIVMELYLPEELHAANKYFMRHIRTENLPSIKEMKGNKIESLRVIFRRIFDREHPLRVNNYFLDSVEVVRQIGGKL
ncbi:MAG: hypothetical protein F6K47_43440, partial [Symploca sp. SIO2E6]|nr:hypothetical protein [Symploca sp. SIO2E6]